MRGVIICGTLLLLGCANVAQMQRQYEAGDEKQLGRLVEIAARPTYPYGTRRKAARALGEIGDPRTVGVLTDLLFEPQQRSTLRQEALIALGRIGDQRAVKPIGLMLDMHLRETDAEVRLIALETLGILGGAEAAEVLVNALRYYDIMLMRAEQRAYRGVFSGEEGLFPRGYGHPHARAHGDTVVETTGGPSVRGVNQPGGPGLEGMHPPVGPLSMFGTQMHNPYERPDTTEEEHELTRQAILRVGEPALAVIDDFLYQHETTQSLQRTLNGLTQAIEERAASGTPEPDEAALPAVPEQAP